MLFVLNVQLASLQVNVVDVEVVLVELHMDHLLPLLVHLVFFQAFVDLVDLVAHLRLIFNAEEALNLRFWSVKDLTGLDLFRLLIAQMEIDDCPANLNRPALSRVNVETLLDHDESSELAQVVEQDEAVVEEFDLRVVPRHGNVIDSQVLVQASAQFESVHAHVRLENLNYATRALFQSQTLKHDVVAVRLLDVHKRVLASIRFEDVRVNLLTDLAAESSPVNGPARERSVFILLRFEPVLETDVMHVSDASAAFADRE